MINLPTFKTCCLSDHDEYSDRWKVGDDPWFYQSETSSFFLLSPINSGSPESGGADLQIPFQLNCMKIKQTEIRCETAIYSTVQHQHFDITMLP